MLYIYMHMKKKGFTFLNFHLINLDKEEQNKPNIRKGRK